MNVVKVTLPSSINRDGVDVSKQYTGFRAGLNFNNGVAYTENELNPGQRAYFKRKGYTVTEEGASKRKKGGKEGDGEE